MFKLWHHLSNPQHTCSSRDGAKLLKARQLPRSIDLSCQLERAQKVDADQVQTDIQWLIQNQAPRFKHAQHRYSNVHHLQHPLEPLQHRQIRHHGTTWRRCISPLYSLSVETFVINYTFPASDHNGEVARIISLGPCMVYFHVTVPMKLGRGQKWRGRGIVRFIRPTLALIAY